MTTPVEPHIWVEDLSVSVDWYHRVLGFEVAQWYPNPKDATWCQMARGDASIMLAATPEPTGYLAAVPERMRGPAGAVSLYLHVDDADAVHDRAIAAGAEPIEPLWDAWWGGRQFTVEDPDGNWWTVFRPTD